MSSESVVFIGIVVVRETAQANSLRYIRASRFVQRPDVNGKRFSIVKQGRIGWRSQIQCFNHRGAKRRDRYFLQRPGLVMNLRPVKFAGMLTVEAVAFSQKEF